MYATLLELTGIGAQVKSEWSFLKRGVGFVVSFTGDEVREMHASGEDLKDLIPRWMDWAHAGLMRTVRPVGAAECRECETCGASFDEIRPGVWRAKCRCGLPERGIGT